MNALCVIGTRPEAIKLAPVIRELRAAGHTATVCTTGQQNVREQLAHFRMEAQIELGRVGETPLEMLAFMLHDLEWVLRHRPHDAIVAQGDTTSAFAAANVAFLLGIPLVHVEAGLRTFDLSAPFPEEYYRRCVSLAASVHCAPTSRAANQLIDEGIDGRVVTVTGQTGIDALKWTLEQIGYVDSNDYVVLTCHRKENRDRQAGICAAVEEIKKQHRVLYVRHPNPATWLNDLPVTDRWPEQSYANMATLLAGCKAILTDSGGLQEEACYLGKPTVVLRDSTERPEAVDYGTAFIAGTEKDSILAAFEEAMAAERSTLPCPYGDGTAAEKVVAAMESALCG